MIDTFGPGYIIISIITILVSLVIHEFMHSFAAYRLGDYTARAEGRLSLNPMAHIDPFMTLLLPIVTLILFHAPILAAKPVPFNPDRVKYGEFGAAIIALAGPLSNLALAFAGAMLGHAAIGSSFWIGALNIFVTINVALFVFNLIPIPPLDGSRVLYAFAPEPLQNLMEQIEPYGFLIIITLVLMGGFGGVIVQLNQMILNLLP